MTIHVKETIIGDTDISGYPRQTTLDGFKAHVMQHATFTDSDYCAYMDSLNNVVWNEYKEAFRSFTISNETWDESTQTYTRIKTWEDSYTYDMLTIFNGIVEESPEMLEKYDKYTNTIREIVDI